MTRVQFRSTAVPPHRTGTAVQVTRARAGWKYVQFAARQIAPGAPWQDATRDEECCLVLLRGACRVEWEDGAADLGPRPNVFAGYPHAMYLPARTRFRVTAHELTELGDGRAPTRRRLQPRLIRPEDCGCEIRGGGNATRQIVDIMPPSFPADRLLVCEVFTPSGNWSSYPPHKHDVDRPPREVKLEEIYYYRFQDPDAFGFQRLYSAEVLEGGSAEVPERGSARVRSHSRTGARSHLRTPALSHSRTSDRTLTVTHGDVVAIRSGYHPFVTAYGYDAYYLNVLAGTRRSMAASDDPRYARLRAWPPPDGRLPLVPPPGGLDHL